MVVNFCLRKVRCLNDTLLELFPRPSNQKLEPTTYLDVSHQLEVMAVARRLAGDGKAVVLVLHDLCMALQCADEVAVLSQGRMVQVGTPEQIYSGGALERVMGVILRRVETENGWRYYYLTS